MPRRSDVRLWKPRALEGVTLLRAQGFSQRFARHTHEEYALGVITDGALGFDYRGKRQLAGRGEINLVVPGEAHTGHPALGETWSYRMFYVQPALLQQLAREVSRAQGSLPFFSSGVVRDPLLAHAIAELHLDMDADRGSALEIESRVIKLLSDWIVRHAELRAVQSVVRADVSRVREFLEECWEDQPKLEQLAALVNLTPFQLLRAFKRQFGLPPHAYLIQRQVREAKSLLDAGWRVIDAAAAAGFADQSHMHRHFKRIWGVTPGEYCNFVQETARR